VIPSVSRRDPDGLTAAIDIEPLIDCIFILIAVRERVRRFVAGRPRAAVVLVPDRRTPAEALVRVMDAARAGGAERIALATLHGDSGAPGAGAPIGATGREGP
jgi:biopolymer transport protein ExbD